MKYALIINGVVDTIALQEPLEKVGTEAYQVQQGTEDYEEQVGTADVLDPETGLIKTVPIMERRLRPIYATFERDVMARIPGFVEVPDNVFPGFVQESDTLVPPPPSLEDVKFLKQAELERLAASKRVRIAGTSDGLKIAVYQQKFQIALAALEGDEAALAALEPEASARGETPTGLAELVAHLGNQWRAGGLAIDANYQKVKLALIQAQTVDEVGALDISAGWPV